MAVPARITKQFFTFMMSPFYNCVIYAMFPHTIYSNCSEQGLKNRWGLVPGQMQTRTGHQPQRRSMVRRNGPHEFLLLMREFLHITRVRSEWRSTVTATALLVFSA